MIQLIEVIPAASESEFTARLPDLPAYGEGSTADEAVRNLREAILEFIEDVGAERAMSRMRLHIDEWM